MMPIQMQSNNGTPIHSGIVFTTTFGGPNRVGIRSKWGALGVYEHYIYDSPFCLDSNMTYLLVLSLLIVVLFSLCFYKGNVTFKYGNYRVTECIWLSLSSSSRALEKAKIKQNLVTISEDTFQITYPSNMITDVSYEIDKMDADRIEKLEKFHIPISDYKTKKVCSIYTYGGKRKEPFELYLLDDTIWLVAYSKGSVFHWIAVLEYEG